MRRCMDGLADLLDQLNGAVVDASAATPIGPLVPDRYELCDAHQVYRHEFGCIVCNA